MFLVENNNIMITKGDTGKFQVKLKNGDGTDYVFSEDDMVVFTVKRKKESFCPVVMVKTGTDIEFKCADTEKIPSGEYVFDVLLERKTGERYTAIEGKFEVRKAVHNFE